MKDYRSTTEKFTYSPVMQSVYEEMLTRLKPNRMRESTYTGRDPDGKNPFLDSFLETRGEVYCIRLAKAIVRSWMEAPPELFDGDVLVGFPRPRRPLYEHFSFGIQFFRKRLEDPSYDAVREQQLAQMEELKGELYPLDRSYLEKELSRRFAPEQGDEAWKLATEGLWHVGGYQGHTVPNFELLLKMGIGGIHAQVQSRLSEETDAHKRETLTACAIILEGFRDWMRMQADFAERKAKKGGEFASRYETAAANCRAVSWDAPRTYHEACQLLWSYSLWDCVDCLGRLDRYLYPFFEKAVQEDRAWAEEITASLMMKFLEHGIHNITVGGIRPEDRSDATNDLSFLLLQILRRTHETHPRMSLRIGKNTDPRLLALGVQMWAEGMCDPSIASDEQIIPALREVYGVAPEDADNYTMLGCQEIEIPGKSNFGCEDGILNLAKILELTLNDGRQRNYPDLQVSPHGGKITDCETFEELWSAYETNMKFVVKHFVELCNMGQEIRAANYAKLVKTPLTEACIRRGLSLDEGGAVYNYGVVETAGAQVVADSLTAIKKLVYDEKRISRETLEKALAANFEGFEKERLLLLNKAPKYGNDDPEADAMMHRVLESVWTEIKTYRSIRGQEFMGACSLLHAGVTYGEKTWATPDGRFAGEPLGNSIAPRGGTGKKGLTAMLNSIAKLPLCYGVGGTTANIVIPSDLLRTEEMRRNIQTLMETYLFTGGQLGQITTANVQDLLDAQEHPEQHQDLIVRVGGFSIKFCELKEADQNEIITRYS